MLKKCKSDRGSMLILINNYSLKMDVYILQKWEKYIVE